MIEDVIIVGSGASAVCVAYPMVQAGLSVKMVDPGRQDPVYAGLIPDEPFIKIRQTDPEQYRYFLGDRFEGIPFGAVQVGAQLTPPRQYITKETKRWAPINATGFSPVVSLALGGLASGWSAGAMPFGSMEMDDFPISCDELTPHYEKVAQRIGVSGEMDDLSPFDGTLKNLYPALGIDQNAATILARYKQRKDQLNRKGFYMGKPKLATLSRPHRGRGPDRYLDMSFWGDTDQSVWRPAYTLKELHAYPNFSYRGSQLVESFKEYADGSVDVACTNIQSGQVEQHRARRLILAAGLFGTARIVLKSLNQYGVRVPVVCNPYTYYPMLNLNVLGNPPSETNHSLAQICVVYIPKGDNRSPLHGRVHSYRSLLNFKIIKELPLPYREGIRLVKMLAPSLTVLALDHEDRPTPDKYCMLEKGPEGQPDLLKVVYQLSDAVKMKQRQYEREVLWHFLKLGCIVIKRIFPGYGASLRYGGAFPMNRQERALTVDTNGLLRGTRSVYIVDGSIFPYLPAKGMTFTMMANANRIGEFICKLYHRQ